MTKADDICWTLFYVIMNVIENSAEVNQVFHRFPHIPLLTPKLTRNIDHEDMDGHLQQNTKEMW